MDSPTGLNIVQIAVYASLLLPVNYCLFRHGKRGILGWLCLISFCIIRLVAAVIDQVEKKSGSKPTVTLIVENVGLSPLILAAMGILHEARYHRQSIINSRVEWIYIFFFHTTVLLSLILLVVGMIHLTHPDPSSTSPETGSMKAGFIVLLGCFMTLTGWTIWSFMTGEVAAGSYLGVNASDEDYNHKESSKSSTLRQGTILLYAVLLCLPMILLRGIYGAIALFSSIRSDPRDPYQASSFATNLAANVCMNVLPQLIAGTELVLAGLFTARMARADRRVRAEGVRADGVRVEAVPLTSAPYEGERAKTETAYQPYQA